MRKLIPVLLLALGFGLGFVLFRGVAGQADGGPAAPLRPAAPVGSAFTYQGRLAIEGAPANGAYDLRFRLFDAATGGNQVGSAVIVPDVAVADGLFTVQLDFGSAALAGEARWLEVAVREGTSDGAYSALAGRQRLAPAPYALHAAEAGSVAWTGVQNRPPGLDDGDDDTTYTAGAGLALAGTTFSAEGSPFANLLVVARSGGDFTSVQSALDSIGDAGASNLYLVYVAPGVYTETVTLKPYVTLQGAGEGTTIIRGLGGSQAAWDGTGSATLVGADNATVRHLTVESDGTGQDFTVAIYNNNASPAISHVTASAWGGASHNYGVYNPASSPAMSHVTASASGGSYSYGVSNSSSSAMMTNVTASGSDGSAGNYGVTNYNSSPTMTNVTASASGGNSSYGVSNIASSSPKMTYVTATASGGGSNFGVRNYDCSATMISVTASASGGSSSYGVYNYNSSTTIRDSALSGSTRSVEAANGSSVYVANSQLVGAVASGVTCLNNYNENFVTAACP